MNKQDYEQKRRECWEELCRANPSHNKSIFARKVFDFAFGRSYALGKQEKDAEGEDEMLTVSRKRVQKLYIDYCAECDNEEEGSANRLSLGGRLAVLIELFGSKCLPDETKDDTKNDTKEPTPAEPKYHVGERVRVVSTDKHGHVGQITEVEYEYGCNYYRVSGAEGWHFLEKNLEPYTEPDKNYIPNPAKIVDDILKDGFHEHNRLHVAAMAMQGMLSNTTRFSSYEISDLVRISLNCADALLAECESSAQPLCHTKKGGQE